MDRLARRIMNVGDVATRSLKQVREASKTAGEAAGKSLSADVEAAGNAATREETMGRLRLSRMSAEGAPETDIAAEAQRQAEARAASAAETAASISGARDEYDAQTAALRDEYNRLKENRVAGVTRDEADARMADIAAQVNARREARPDFEAQTFRADLTRDATAEESKIALARSVNAELDAAFGGIEEAADKMARSVDTELNDFFGEVDASKEAPLQTGLEAFFDDMYGQQGKERIVTAGDEMIAAKLDELIERTKPGMRR
jgi:hypothetical protein